MLHADGPEARARWRGSRVTRAGAGGGTAARDERDPLLALAAGDAAPFEDFVRRHARTFVAWFRERGASLVRAEDLAQELFLRLYQQADRYRPEGRFLAFSFRLARNLWIDDCRSAALAPRAWDGPASAASAPEPAAPVPDPAARLARAEEEHELARLLAALPQAQRRVFELALEGELSYGEIGLLLDIPVGTVKSRMFHAVRRLRLLWGRRRGALARVEGRP